MSALILRTFSTRSPGGPITRPCEPEGHGFRVKAYLRLIDFVSLNSRLGSNKEEEGQGHHVCCNVNPSCVRVYCSWCVCLWFVVFGFTVHVFRVMGVEVTVLRRRAAGLGGVGCGEWGWTTRHKGWWGTQRSPGLGFRVQDLGFRFRVHDLGLMV